MRHGHSLFLSLALVLLLSIVGLASPSWADYEAGVQAFGRADYATALREWRPLAEQSHADAQYQVTPRVPQWGETDPPTSREAPSLTVASLSVVHRPAYDNPFLGPLTSRRNDCSLASLTT